MRVLDIDLDLFVNRPAYNQSLGKRLSSEDYQISNKINLLYFLFPLCHNFQIEGSRLLNLILYL